MRNRSMNIKLTRPLAPLTVSAQGISASSSGAGKMHLLPRSGRRKVFSVRALMAIIAMLAPASAMAGPLGEQYRGGSSLVSRPDNITTLIQQQSQKAVIDWDSFSIGSNEKVKVEQPGTDSILLNRVVGTSPSEIFGGLIANGQVFVVNPHGVVFAPGSHVDVHGLVATTMSISPSTFMAVSDGNYIFTDVANGELKTVTNQGTLTAAEGGYIVLAGDTVDNSGSIAAQSGQVALASGSKMTLDLVGDRLISLEVDPVALATNAGVTNTETGVLMADGGRVVMTAKSADTLIGTVVNNQGQVRARTIQEQGGEILLLGDMGHGTVEVAGTLDASAPTGGNGGSIETAGHRVTVADNTTITAAAGTAAARGKWRLRDEVDFFIGADGAAMLDGGGMSGTTLSNALATTDVVIERTGPPATGSTIPTAAAQKTMASAITSASATADLGDIVVGSEVLWDTDSTLTLQANNNVVVNAPIKNIGSGEIILRADLDADNSGTVAFNLGSSIGSLMIGGQASIFYNPAYYSDYDLKQGEFSTYVAATSTGTLNTFMLVNDIDHLQDINTNLSASYALGQDIDATVTKDWNGGAGFVPLGPGEGIFMGTFTGNGYTISHLTINTPNTLGPTGLFGIASGSDIRDVGLVDANITGNAKVGALIGQNYGKVSGAYSTGTVFGAGDYVGGLIGYNEGDVDNSYSTSTVTGIGSVGGLIGENYGTISKSYSTGTVDGGGDDVGGLVGYNEGGDIVDSYSTSAVTGTSYVGGLIGYNYLYSGIASISRTYSTGTVTGSGDYVGGLIGAHESGVVESTNNAMITGSYSSSNVTGNQYVGGLIGHNTNGVAMDSHSTGAVTGTHSVGGLIGYNYYGFITNTYNSGSVVGADQKVGGLIGANDWGTINSSYNVGKVTGGVNAVDAFGGLVGFNTGTVLNSYSTGAVTGTESVGGLVGNNDAGSIVGSYSTGVVSGTNYVGGLVGYDTSNGESVSNSFWDQETSGQSVSAGGQALTTAQMLDDSSFTGWDFTAEGVWWLSQGNTRPFLRSEYNTTIVNAHQLQLMALDLGVGVTYTLGRNILMEELSVQSGMWNTSTGFVPVSDATTQFAGTFDGAGYTITGLFINRPTTQYVGLFGGAQDNSLLKDVGLIDVNITGGFQTGGLAAHLGVGTIERAYTTGTVTGTSNTVGGLVGLNAGEISDSYSTATVKGQTYVGGLVGSNWGGNSTITRSYSAGKVNGVSSVGGLVGTNYQTTTTPVMDSYWNVETSQQTSSAGGTGLTTAEMKAPASYPGWDFTATWRIYAGVTYPLLKGFLTPLAITIMANDASRIYGEQNPVFDKTILGAYDPTHLQGWDTLQLTSEAGLYSPVGNYAIVPSGQLSSTVYDIIFQDGTLTVTTRPLTLIDPIQVADKVYDGNQFATVTSYGALVGVVADDIVSVAGAAATFDTKDVGKEKQVTISDFVLGGIDANNYIVDPETVLTSLADITAKPLSVSIIGDPSKVYDGTKIAHLTPANFDLKAFVPGEDATISQTTGQYDNPEVGSHTVTSALTKTDFIPVTGTSLANYLLPSSAAGPGTITEKPVPEKPPVVDEVVVKEKAKDEVVGVTSEIIASTIPEDLTKESMQSEGGSKGSETANGEGDASDENKEKEKKVGGTDSDQENELKEQPLLSLDSGAVAGQNMVCK